MGDKEFDPHERTSPIARRRGGGQPKPRTPSGKNRLWEPPTGGTTPADRKEKNVNRED